MVFIYMYNIYKILFRFLTTDSDLLKREYIIQYPQYIITYNSTITHSGYQSLKGLNDGIRDTFIDIYLYSRANYRLLTQGTTYGYLGAIIAGTNNTLYSVE